MQVSFIHIKQVSLIELMVVSVILGILAMAVIDLQSVSVARKKESQLRENLNTMRTAITQFTTQVIAQSNIQMSSGLIPASFSINSLATAIVYVRPRVASGSLEHQALVAYCQNAGLFGTDPTDIGQQTVIISTSTGLLAKLPPCLMGSYPYGVFIEGMGSCNATMPAFLRKMPKNPYKDASWTIHYIATGSLASPAFALSNVTAYGVDKLLSLDGTNLVDF